MRIFNRLGVMMILALGGFLLASLGANARVATNIMRMTIGDENAGHINIEIDRSRGYGRVAIHMYRVGAPGSRFTLSIGGRPVVAPFILNDKQCWFDAAGSRCNLSISQNDRAFKPLLAAFRSGRPAHVTVENAGNVAMSTDVSLRTFSRFLRQHQSTPTIWSMAKATTRINVRPTFRFRKPYSK